MQKFIITEVGTMVFGDVRLHRDLIPDGDDTCHGGGFWRIDNLRGCIILYGRSNDFGPPEFGYLRRIDTSCVPGSLGYPMFYQREFAGGRDTGACCLCKLTRLAASHDFRPAGKSTCRREFAVV